MVLLSISREFILLFTARSVLASPVILFWLHILFLDCCWDMVIYIYFVIMNINSAYLMAGLLIKVANLESYCIVSIRVAAFTTLILFWQNFVWPPVWTYLMIVHMGRFPHDRNFDCFHFFSLLHWKNENISKVATGKSNLNKFLILLRSIQGVFWKEDVQSSI